MSQPYALPPSDAQATNDGIEPLPPRAYTAQDWFEREQALISDRCWQLPPIASVPKSQRDAFSHLLFPNFGIVADAESWSSLQIVPLAVDKTVVNLHVLADRSVKPGSLGKAVLGLVQAVASKTRTARLSNWKSGDLMDEDIVACEAIQLAIGSPAFELGPLAEHFESPIAGFQQHLLHRLSAKT